jgi:enoyl-[acyl-carrier protein] reductase I
MIDLVHERAPLKRPFSQPEVASSALYLLSDLSRGVTGQVLYIDNGYNVLGL